MKTRIVQVAIVAFGLLIGCESSIPRTPPTATTLLPSPSPSVVSAPSPPPSSSPRVTVGPTRASTPTVSLSDEHIAFCTNREGNWDIYLVDGEGRGASNLTQHGRDDGCVSSRYGTIFLGMAWAPDGGELAFVSNRSAGEEYEDVYVTPVDEYGHSNTARKLLADAPNIQFSFFPAWSPDGNQIAFVTTSEEEYEYRIFIVDRDGSHVVPLSMTDQIQAFHISPIWSPTGREIAFLLIEGAGGVGIIQVDSGKSVFVTNETTRGKILPAVFPHHREGAFPGPTWSPDGDKLAFSAMGRNSLDRLVSLLFVVGADGIGLRKLVDIDATFPAWSPNQELIAFQSGDHIHVVDSDGKGLRTLTSVGRNMAPQWSPDGMRITFASDRDGNWEVYVMNADGSEQINLTNNPADDVYPIWRPGK